MPNAILNIELDDKPGLPSTVEGRYVLALALVRKVFSRSIGEIATAEYLGPDGVVESATAVISFEYHCDKHIVRIAADSFARSMSQDCVAVLYGDGQGELVGPGAARWGDFKPEFLKFPAAFAVYQRAA